MRALRAGLSLCARSFHTFLFLSEKKHVRTSPGVWRGNWDKNGMKSGFMPLDYAFGSDFMSLDRTFFLYHTRVKWEWTGLRVL